MSQVQKIMNPMQKPHIAKIVVNISVGESGEPLQRAVQILEQLTGHKSCQRKAKTSVRDWGIRKGEPIACITTLRGQTATDFLRRALDTVSNRLPKSKFDVNGNFSFGIKEHIEIPGVKYDPGLGIIGMDVCITIEMPGYCVKRRHKSKAKVGRRQRATPEEAMEYVKELFGVEILEEVG